MKVSGALIDNGEYYARLSALDDPLNYEEFGHNGSVTLSAHDEQFHWSVYAVQEKECGRVFSRQILNYVQADGSFVDSMLWNSVCNLALDGVIEAKNPLALIVIAPHIRLSNVTFVGIDRVALLAFDSSGSSLSLDLASGEGEVIVDGIGSLPELLVSARFAHFAGRNVVDKFKIWANVSHVGTVEAEEFVSNGGSYRLSGELKAETARITCAEIDLAGNLAVSRSLSLNASTPLHLMRNISVEEANLTASSIHIGASLHANAVTLSCVDRWKGEVHINGTLRASERVLIGSCEKLEMRGGSILTTHLKADGLLRIIDMHRGALIKSKSISVVNAGYFWFLMVETGSAIKSDSLTLHSNSSVWISLKFKSSISVLALSLHSKGSVRIMMRPDTIVESQHVSIHSEDGENYFSGDDRTLIRGVETLELSAKTNLTLNNVKFVTSGPTAAISLTANTLITDQDVTAPNLLINATHLPTNAAFSATSGNLTIASSNGFALNSTLHASDRLTLHLGSNLVLGSNAKVRAGSLDLAVHGNVTCVGCEVWVGNRSSSSISADFLSAGVTSYSVSADTLHQPYFWRWVSGCAKHVMWWCDTNDYSSATGSVHVVTESHTYGKRAIMAFNGTLALDVKGIVVNGSAISAEHAEFLRNDTDVDVIGHTITKTATISKSVMDRSNCAQITQKFGLPGAPCAWDGYEYKASKVIDVLSAVFAMRRSTGKVRNLRVHGAREAESRALTIASVPAHLLIAPHYIAKSIQEQTIEAISASWKFFSTNPQVLFANSKRPLALEPFSPEIRLGSEVLQIDTSETLQTVMDNAQYEFLLELGADLRDKAPEKFKLFSFDVWRARTHKFVYQQTNFRLLALIERYGHAEAFDLFAQNAVDFYKSTQDRPTIGVALTPQQQDLLTEPIVWPVYECLGFLCKERGISYEVYVPAHYISQAIVGAAAIGDFRSIAIAQTVHIDAIGAIVQIDSRITEEANARKAQLRYERAVVTEEDGEIATINIGHKFINLGTVISTGGMGLRIETGGFYNSGRVMTRGSAEIVAPEIEETCVKTKVGDVIDCPKWMVGGSLYQRATTGNIKQEGLTRYVSGDSTITAAGDISKTTILNKREKFELCGYACHQTTEFLVGAINQERIDGKALEHAGGVYTATGATIIASGGSVFGEKGTVVQAAIAETSYYRYHRRERMFSTTTTIRSGSYEQHIPSNFTSQGTQIAVGTNTSRTFIQGLIAPNIKLIGGDKSEVKAVELKEKHRIEVETTGLTFKKPSADMAHIRGVRHIESIAQGDWLGAITGGISDAVNMVGTFKGTKALLGSQTVGANAVALLAAVFGEMASITFSLGTQLTIITSEGTTRVGNQLGKDGSVTFDINGDLTIEDEEIRANTIDGVIVGTLTIKAPESKHHQEIEHTQDSFDFSLSPFSIGIGFSSSETHQSTDSTAHKQAGLSAGRVTLMVGKNLELLGALIDGEKVSLSIDGDAVIKQILDTTQSESSSTGFSVGIAIGWTGIAPQFGIQGSDESKSEGLAKVVASITGEDVTITAKRLIAQINAVAQNATVQAERVESKDEPVPYLDRTKTSYGISVSAQVGKDGGLTMMPSAFISTEHEDLSGIDKTSLYLSIDLFEGIKHIGDWINRPSIQQIEAQAQQAYDALGIKEKKEVDKVVDDYEKAVDALETVKDEPADSKQAALMHGKLKKIAEVITKLNELTETHRSAAMAARLIIHAATIARSGLREGIKLALKTAGYGAAFAAFVTAIEQKGAAFLQDVDPSLTQAEAATIAAFITAVVIGANDLKNGAGFGPKFATAGGPSSVKDQTPVARPNVLFNKNNGKGGGGSKQRVTSESFATGPMKLSDGAKVRIGQLPKYHHTQSQGGVKSPFPKDPLTALKGSVQSGERSRVGVDAKNKEFVVFMQGPMEGDVQTYHPYATKWEGLNQRQQGSLVEAGLANRRGKIK